jgi:hypothetical protein
MGKNATTSIIPAQPKWRFGIERFEAADSLDVFIGNVLEYGYCDVIARTFLKGYMMPVFGVEGNPLRECCALNVGVYAPILGLKYEQRVGKYASDPKQIGISYEIREFEIVTKVDPFAPLNEVVGASRSKEDIVNKLTSEGIGVFDGGLLRAGEELAYMPPLSVMMVDYEIDFFYGKSQPPTNNGVLHSILPKGSRAHMGVQPSSFDAEDDDWHGEWKPSEAAALRLPRRA